MLVSHASFALPPSFTRHSSPCFHHREDDVIVVEQGVTRQTENRNPNRKTVSYRCLTSQSYE
ncbi:hypothetical protein MUK42_13669 [Musa troglodytarum]|uniref:Uncharacterized protein n=1 Tax=Musa troglodytarum TaxID=320322 RepID=A0A9E7I7V9_9LILI|nr:hypothetical protein MUK42_13669 [Musa troglodytarum]